MKRLLITCILPSLIGCASQMVWYQDGRTYEEAQKDFQECKYDAVKYGYVPIQYNAYPNAPGAAGFAAGQNKD